VDHQLWCSTNKPTRNLGTTMSATLNIGYQPQIIYTMIRVIDLKRSVFFYTQILAMNEFRQQEYPKGRFTLVFVGYGDEFSNSTIELTYNWDQTDY
jgi:lactoylglutathione lyase